MTEQDRKSNAVRGNLLRQPAFVELTREDKGAVKVTGKMTGSDHIMNNTLFLGTYPGLSEKMLKEEIKVITEFVKSRK